MTTDKQKLKQFAALAGIPRFLHSWIDRFYEPEDIDLVLLLAKGPKTAAEVGRKVGKKSSAEMKTVLHRAFKRGIIEKRADNRYVPADFHARYEIWALFEGWQDVPEDIRKRLNHWELRHYTKKHRRDISDLKKAKRDDSAICPEYILLNEAELLLDKVEHIYLWPCNCRAMVEGCKKPITTCLRFSNNRGLGWEISRTRAKKILHEADRAGLMHSAEIGLLADGTIDGAICNCCVDCCFPHLLAEDQKVQKLWPLTRYIARRIKEKCTTCGLCAKRCPFNAFRMRKRPAMAAGKNTSKKTKKRQIVFYGGLCRGCGLCATGCPEDAIEMDPLPQELSLWERISG